MKVKDHGDGSTTFTFHHVRHMGMERKDTLFMIEFDGEPDFWYLEPGSTIEQGLGELEIYYRRDWKESGRPILNVKVFKLTQDTKLVIDR